MLLFPHFRRLRRLAAGLLCIGACAGSSLQAAPGKAHQHGAAEMQVAVEGELVSISLQMPLDSLVGFERAPRTAAERQAAASALERIRDAGRLFRLDAAAQCSLKSFDLDSGPLQVAGQAPVQPASEHADLRANWEYRCAQPKMLAHLEVLLFEAFPRLERIQTQLALPHGQARRLLNRSSRGLRLNPTAPA
jgi:hypothetical protein